MKKYLLLALTIILSTTSFGQDLTKEDKVARKELFARMWTPQLKWISGTKDGRETYYTNEPDPVTYNGLSDEFNAQKDELEKYFLSNLFPMRFIGKSGSEYVYFPTGWAYSDSYYRMHLKRYQVFSNKVTLNRFFDFNTPAGAAIVAEFKEVQGDGYFHGLIMLDELNGLLARAKNGEIGIMEDERDGSFYKWSKIGNQKWFSENLKYKLEEHTEMDRQLGFNAYRARYYNYGQAMTSCPKGWHLPSDDEWKDLELLAGVWPVVINVEGFVSRDGEDTIPRIELMEGERLMFHAHTAGAVSKSFGHYSEVEAGNYGYFWSSTKADEVNAMFRMVGKSFDGVARDRIGAQNYLSCRCVEDQDISVLVAKHPELKEITDKINAEPSNASNYFDRSGEFLLLGEGNRAMEDIDKAIELDPANPEQKLFKAQLLYLYSFDQNADETRKLVDDYLATVKDNSYAYYFQSRLTLYDAEAGALNATRDEERRKKSLSSINKALELDPKNPHYLEYKSKLYVVMREYAKAVKSLEKMLVKDPENGETYFLLGKMKLRNFDYQNKKNGVNTTKWCTALTGICFKVTPAQLTEVCKDFTKAINYGTDVNLDYITLCNELEQAKTLKEHQPIIHIGPRGGRYTISSGGNKVYIPRR